MDSSSIATTVFNGVSTVVPITATATSLAASIVQGGSSTTPANPLLEYQPGFTRSLVIQMLVLSCVATLTLVLLLHLAFTTRYHFPLAKTNYLILTSGCFLSFIAILWQLGEIGMDTRLRAREWPFMFDYLEFVFPADSWSTTKAAVWLTFNAVVIFLCHAAHIHVLTLLYPSKLEARFLLAILLPLALIGVALSYSPLIDEQRQQDIFDSGSAVCNSTLTLLYTCALLFWGLYIARARAWGKTDESGSTAVFGGCAIGMAMIGTALSFVSVRAGQEQAGGSQGWLARITWLVLLWQTWFTVWWWIGAGMYNAERPLEDVEDEEPQSTRSKINGFGGTVHRAIGDGINTLRRRRKQPTATSEEIEMASLDNAARTEHHVAAEISSISDSTATNTPPTFLATLLKRIRKAHINAAKQAQRDLMHNAQSDPNMNDAIQGRRGKGWSVSGILKSREDTVIRSVSANAIGRMSKSPSHRGDREEHRVGAARLDDHDTPRSATPTVGDWEDISEERQQYPPPANHLSQPAASETPRPVDARTARWTSWRRKDVTRYD